MTRRRRERRRSHAADLGIAALALGAGVVLTLMLWWSLDRRAERLEDSAFDAEAARTLDGVETAATEYLHEIQDLASFAGTHDPPANDLLLRFAHESGVFAFSNTQIVIYVERVKADELGEVIARERAAGDTDFLPVTTRLGGGEDLFLLMRGGTETGPVSWIQPIDFGEVDAAIDALNRSVASGNPTVVDFGAVFAEVFRPGGLLDELGLDRDTVMTEVLSSLDEGSDGPDGLALGMPVWGREDPNELAGWIAVGMLPDERIAEIQASAGDDLRLEVAFVPGSEVQLLTPSDEIELYAGDTPHTGAADHVEERTVEVEGLSWRVAVSGWGDFGATSASDLARVALLAGLALSAALSLLVYVRARFASRTGEVLEQLDRTEHRAFHDELTGLLNRAGLTEELRAMVAEQAGDAPPCAVLFIDVDRLKVINDSLGHTVGDIALRAVGERFSRVSRPEDRVARFGGDEFVVVCREVTCMDDAMRVAQRLLQTFDEPIVVGDAELVLSASVGIAMISPDGETDADAVLRDADAAMYRAKSAGGSSIVVFDETLRHDATERLELEHGLRAALDRDQIEVYLQEISAIHDLTVVGYEALVRWRHPETGLVQPPRFLPVAEETGLIVPVGYRVIEQSVEAVARLREAGGVEPVVAINLSERQLVDAGLQERLAVAMERFDVAPSSLGIEVTEEVIIDPRGRVQGVLRSLAGMGLSISIDDFGTGVSSLAAIRSLEMVDTVKIDRAFLASLDRDPTDRAIVRAIVAMAEALGIRLVAEGVERLTQLEVLRDLGVHCVQGFALGRPRPVEEIVRDRRAATAEGSVRAELPG